MSSIFVRIFFNVNKKINQVFPKNAPYREYTAYFNKKGYSHHWKYVLDVFDYASLGNKDCHGIFMDIQKQVSIDGKYHSDKSIRMDYYTAYKRYSE